MTGHGTGAFDEGRGAAFAKGHGTGNDFVLIADAEGAEPLTAERVRTLADRRFGIGGDGVIRAVPAGATGDAVLDALPAGTWAMDYWNADGTLSEMCGNGVRVFVHFLLQAELARLAIGEGIDIATRLIPARVAMSMPSPSASWASCDSRRKRTKTRTPLPHISLTVPSAFQ